MDLSLLDADESAGGLRRLREVLVGCGSCKDTIRIPEARMGKSQPCPRCGVLLKVDQFDLSKAKGDLIDMSHLELDTADPLVDDTGHGSTLGGSSIQLEGTGSFAAFNDASSGSMAGSDSSQTQMRELRELNDLKHSGAISNSEYKQRKSEIYSGKSLAIQATSRSADGSGNRPVLGRAEAALPGPIKALIVVAVLGIGGVALWATVLKPAGPSADHTVAKADASAKPTKPKKETEAVVEGPSPEELAAEAQEQARLEAAEAQARVEREAKLAAERAVEEAEAQQRIARRPVAESGLFNSDSEEGSGGSFGGAFAGEQSMVQVEGGLAVTDWPGAAQWPDYRPSGNQPIAQACSVIKRIAVRDDAATIGVAVGGPAFSLEDEDYLAFRQAMHDIFLNHAEAQGIMTGLNVRASDRPVKLGGLQCHRLHATSKANRKVQATIVTTVQDGYAVAYWFAGDRKVYPKFLPTVGTAELGRP